MSTMTEKLLHIQLAEANEKISELKIDIEEYEEEAKSKKVEFNKNIYWVSCSVLDYEDYEYTNVRYIVAGSVGLLEPQDFYKIVSKAFLEFQAGWYGSKASSFKITDTLGMVTQSFFHNV